PGGGPVWVSEAMGGRPALRFTNDTARGMVMASGYVNTTNCATAFVVAQRRLSQTGFTGLLSIYKDGEEDYNTPHATVFFQFEGGPPYHRLKGYRDDEDGGALFIPAEVPVCLMSRYDGTSHCLARDDPGQKGNTSWNASVGFPFDADRVVIANRAAPANGFNYPLNGDIAEVLLYNRVLTDAEERFVFAYLNAKWGIGSMAGGDIRPPVEATLSRAAVRFDASRVETISTNALGEVLAWTNLYSEAALVPAITGQNPLYLTGEGGGLPAVRFDSSLANALQIQQGQGYMNGSRSATLFAVVTPREEQFPYAGIASISRSGTADFNGVGCAVFLAYNGAWQAYQGDKSLGSGCAQPEKVSVLMSSYNKGQHTMRVNGAFGDPPIMWDVAFEATCLRVGNRIEELRTFSGDVHEIMVFNCPLAQEEIEAVTEYLDTKWRRTGDIGDLLAEADVRFDASDETSVTTNALGAVTALKNLNAHTVAEIPAQAGCEGPLYVEDAMNGLPVLRFDRAKSNALMMVSGYTNTGAFLTAFAVVRVDRDNWENAGLLSVMQHDRVDYNGTENAVVMIARSGGPDRWGAFRAGGEKGVVNDVPFRTPFTLMSRFDGLFHTAELDGNICSAPMPSTETFGADRLLIGARQEDYPDPDDPSEPPARLIFATRFLSGDVAEVLVYNRAVTPAEAATLRDYLREKWYPDAHATTVQDLQDSALVWLDASATDTLAVAPDGLVMAWTNRNNHAAVFTPPPGCDGPVWIADGMNGLPVLRFDKDALPNQMLMCDSGYALTTTAVTAVAMMRPRTDQVENGRLLATWKDQDADHSNTDGATLIYAASNGERWQTHRSGRAWSVCTNIVPETPTCLISRFDGFSHRMIQDGTNLCTAAWESSGAFNANRLAIGSRTEGSNPLNEWYNGDVAEVLLFDYALSPDQYQVLVDHLTAKWITPRPPEPDGTEHVEVCAGAVLDVRNATPLLMPGALFGAGTVWGDVVMGGRLWATDHQLTIDGDLTMRQGASLEVDYSGGFRPLVAATGQLVLEDLNVTAYGMREVKGSAMLAILQGGTGWHDGDGNAPDPTGWTLTGGVNGAAFLLDPSAYRVNIKLARGTRLMLK
ncbi:MAG: hypothetical protein FWH21_01660, partial [Kiritimatiellaeota bacterium]|nr:hypothetical protein [Kiritimatiellota bacterium]